MAATKKIDYEREPPELYRARSEPAIVRVPELAYLMIDGHGAPKKMKTIVRQPVAPA
jgi:hypothetical protein